MEVWLLPDGAEGLLAAGGKREAGVSGRGWLSRRRDGGRGGGTAGYERRAGGEHGACASPSGFHFMTSKESHIMLISLIYPRFSPKIGPGQLLGIITTHEGGKDLSQYNLKMGLGTTLPIF